MNNLKQYIEDHPYPSYDDMLKRIKRCSNNWEIYSEYGEINHNCLKEIYENFYNIKDIAKSNGYIIYNKGGHQAMLNNYYAFIYSPFYDSNDLNVRTCYMRLQYLWDGVGSWKA